MNTRDKILERIEDVPEVLCAAGNGKVLAFCGFFDVLTPSLVERVNAAATEHPDCSMVALVLELNGALLTQRGRAELAASLENVDVVVPVDSVARALETLAPDLVVRDEESQLADRRILIQHVHRRYQD